jgi:predicted DNA-binding transcriptional regulator AlpA
MSTEQFMALGIDPRLRMVDLLPILAISEAEVYRRIEAGYFPRGIRESHRVSIYLLSEVRIAIESGFTHDFSVINALRKEESDFYRKIMPLDSIPI